MNSAVSPAPGPAAASPGLPKRRLDRAQVLEAARVLSDAGGFEAFTIKQLADMLGIKPPSVYAHFDGLPELRRELALWGFRALAQKIGGAAVGLTGRDALLALGRAHLEFIRTSPGLYSATVPSPDVGDVALRGAADACITVYYQVIAAFGLNTEDAIHAQRGVRSIVHGFGMLEQHGAFRTLVDRDTSFDQVLRTFVDAIELQRVSGAPVAAVAPRQPGSASAS